MKVITEIEVEVTKKEIVKVPEGYEAKMGDGKWLLPEGSKFLHCYTNRWTDVAAWTETTRSNDRWYAIPIKLDPELIIHEGKRYEVVTDPSYVCKVGDIWSYANKPERGWNSWGDHLVSDIKSLWSGCRWEVARPLASESYEGEVVLDYAHVVYLPEGRFTPGDRVKIEVIK